MTGEHLSILIGLFNTIGLAGILLWVFGHDNK